MPASVLLLASLLSLPLTVPAPRGEPAGAPRFLMASAAPASVGDSLTLYYAAWDAPSIERLYARARTQEERLLCLYRLFPLTQDDAWIREIPSAEGATTARELALLAALWAYRAAHAPPWRLPTYGRRSERLLARARRLDASEPYVLLVEGQSLYYKPALFGGSVAGAEARFERLRDVLRRRPAAGIHPLEAEVWIWMVRRRRHDPDAENVRRDLLARHPPPLFRQWLVDPP